MFKKIRYTFYDMVFEFYGALYWYYRARDNEAKVKECIDKRSDMLELMFTLKGIA